MPWRGRRRCLMRHDYRSCAGRLHLCDLRRANGRVCQFHGGGSDFGRGDEPYPAESRQARDANR